MLKMESNNGGVHLTIEGDGTKELLIDMIVGVRGIMESLRDESEWSEDDERFMQRALKEFFVPCVLAETDEESENIILQTMLRRMIEEVFDGKSEHKQD